MSRTTALDVLGLFFVLTIVMVLVRPNSLAPAFLQEFGAGLSAVVRLATVG